MKLINFPLLKQFRLLNTYTDEQLRIALQAGEEWALDYLFRAHYTYLCQTVYRVLPDRVMAEDLVQEVFYELWRKRKRLNIQQSIRAYLRRAATNKTLNYIRDQRLVVDDESAMPLHVSSKEAGVVQQLEADELQQEIEKAVAALPERCRLVFGLSRFEGLSNKEIAAQLEISVKTVENQMTKALKLIKSALEPYFPFLGIGFFALLDLIVH